MTQKPKRTRKTKKAKTLARIGSEVQIALRWVASLFLLVFLLVSYPTEKNALLWLGQHCDYIKLPFNLTVDGIKAEWAYSSSSYPNSGLTPKGCEVPFLNQSQVGGLIINGSRFSKGVCVHAPSRIAFAVDGKAVRFSCQVGMDSGSNESLTRGAVCHILADGKEILVSPKLTRSSNPFPVDVPVTGVKELILWADTTDLEDLGTYVDWVDLKFTH